MKKIYIKILSVSFVILIGMSILMWMQFKNLELYKDTSSVAIKIKHLDEVLTMSARMAAYTGDLKWIERYDNNVIILDKVLKKAKEDQEILNYIQRIDKANNKLIEMEMASFTLVKAKKLQEAQKTLSSPTYEKYKNDYSQGINDIISYLNDKYDQSTSELSMNYQNSLLLITLLLIVAAIFGIYVMNILQIYNDKLKKMTSKLDALANTDELTNIFNRRYCDNMLKQEVKYYKRYQRPFSVLMADIDHFKKVNDTYGHDKGDFVLKSFANILLSSSREVDIICRWGGEEFMIIAPDTSTKEAEIFAEKIRKKVETSDFDIDENLTVSLGVIEYNSNMSLKELILNVDSALYQAKASGRNKTVVFN